MAQILSISIDLNKIDKNRIIVGAKGGKYYNLQVFVNDQKDTYGNDIAVAEGQTKEEREAKAKKKYLGNGRIIWSGQGNPPPQKNNDTSNTAQSESDLPW